MNGPLNSEEIAEVRKAVLRGKKVKLYLCYQSARGYQGVFRAVFKVDGAILDNDPEPYKKWKALLDWEDFKWFHNYWHAYAYKLRGEAK